jgi:predicted transposase
MRYTALMKQALLVKLAPDEVQRVALLRTLEAFNAACNWIAERAYAARCANKIALQKLVYYGARERFGLSSQMVVRAISKVVEAYSRSASRQRQAPRFSAGVHDFRVSVAPPHRPAGGSGPSCLASQHLQHGAHAP